MAISSSRVASALPVAAVVALLVAIEPAPARASGGGTLNLDIDIGNRAAAILIGANIALFGSLDAISIASGRPLPVGISLLQIGLGGLLVPILAGTGSSWTAVHVGAYASAFWFTLHGIHDLAVYPEYRKRVLRERELERERQRDQRDQRDQREPAPTPDPPLEPIYGVSVAPSARGGMTLQFHARL